MLRIDDLENKSVLVSGASTGMEAIRKTVYLGGVGTPGDCVGAFLFLASQQLSGYITGQIIHVNGGQVMP